MGSPLPLFCGHLLPGHYGTILGHMKREEASQNGAGAASKVRPMQQLQDQWQRRHFPGLPWMYAKKLQRYTLSLCRYDD